MSVYPGQTTQTVYHTTIQQPYAPPPPQAQTNVVVLGQPPVAIRPGGCRSCGMGVVRDTYPIEAILLAVCCFPVGIVCCLLMKEKRCANCNLRY